MALQLASDLGEKGFRASSMFLRRWKRRYNVDIRDKATGAGEGKAEMCSDWRSIITFISACVTLSVMATWVFSHWKPIAHMSSFFSAVCVFLSTSLLVVTAWKIPVPMYISIHHISFSRIIFSTIRGSSGVRTRVHGRRRRRRSSRRHVVTTSHNGSSRKHWGCVDYGGGRRLHRRGLRLRIRTLFLRPF